MSKPNKRAKENSIISFLFPRGFVSEVLDQTYRFVSALRVLRYIIERQNKVKEIHENENLNATTRKKHLFHKRKCLRDNAINNLVGH